MTGQSTEKKQGNDITLSENRQGKKILSKKI